MIMWLYGIVVICIVGLVLIFLKRKRKVNDLEKIKMHVNDNSSDQTNSPETKKAEKIVEIDYKLIAEIFNKADLLFGQGKIKEAEKGFVHVLSIHPDHLEANVRLGLLYLENEKYSKAEEIFKHVVSLKNDKSIYYHNLAKACYGQHKLEDARRYYEAAVRINKDDVNSFVNLGHVYTELSIYKPAINAYSKALNLNPKLSNIYFLMTDLLIKVDALSEASACITTFLESHPYDEKAKDKLREIKIKMGVDPLKGAPVKLPQRSKKIRDMIEEAEKHQKDGGEQQSLL
jgi:tetratricopeptide (TPR) repeat protein